MKSSFYGKAFFRQVFLRSVVLICYVLLACAMSVSAQAFERTQPANVQPGITMRKGMVEPFSSQMPIDVYQSRHLHRSNVKVGYQYRNSVSHPEMRRIEIVSGVQKYQSDSRIALSGVQNNGYYTQTPQRMETTESKVTYNSLPTINSKGEAMNISEEDSVVEIGSMQNLPENWDEPSNPTPIGDILFPMLLLVVAYLSIRLFKGFNN